MIRISLGMATLGFTLGVLVTLFAPPLTWPLPFLGEVTLFEGGALARLTAGAVREADLETRLTTVSNALEASEAARAIETARAVSALDDAASRCQARIAEARRSTAAITDIVNEEVPHDVPPAVDGACPRRELFPDDGLRATLGARAP